MLYPAMFSQPNTTTHGDGFYISYNNIDGHIYGGDTTALVWGQMQNFLILNGDHRKGYQPLISAGYDACVAYFRDNIAQINKRSDKL
jgi:hypothetical protein